MHEHLDVISKRFEQLQEKSCAILEKCDGTGKFTKDKWSKVIGGGITRVITNGEKIQKGAYNYSKVSGPLNHKMSQALGVKAKEYAATGISSIFHGRNPNVPSIHMNVRYFAFDNGLEWFGGGIDLSPIYVDVEQAGAFHIQLKEVCDKYDAGFYQKFKSWADEYFFIKHRNETRGVGGIFFDRQLPGAHFDFNRWMEFTTELAGLFPLLYSGIVSENHDKSFSQEHLKWQKIRWGRYAEFILVCDRGTKFGLVSGGNTESILTSLPPEVIWEYQFQARDGSLEERTLQLLKKGIDWINIEER